MRRCRALLVTTASVLCLLAGCSDAPETRDATAASDITGIRFLGGGSGEGFARAMNPPDLEFPADHGPHPEFRNEWWYFTGNLFDGEGRHFGFELTFFRFGLEPPGDEALRESGPPTIWMGHFALTDTAAGQFHAGERLARGDPALAFATAMPLEVRVEDWHLSAPSRRSVRLRAEDGGYSIDLILDGIDAIMLQGDRGLDRKGPEPGNASFYYSAPRLAARGEVSTADTGAHRVTGTAWLDREWGTSALSPGVVGWDWFALQLSDGRDLMYYRLRESNGDPSRFSAGSLRNVAGEVARLDTVDAVPVSYWTSPTTGVRYPVGWRLRIAREELDLVVSPTLPNQELDLAVRYWEGAVTVAGTSAGRPVSGQGYLELAGYQ